MVLKRREENQCDVHAVCVTIHDEFTRKEMEASLQEKNTELVYLDALDRGRPRLLVSLKSVLDLKVSNKKKENKLELVMGILAKCRETYWKEITYLRHCITKLKEDERNSTHGATADDEIDEDVYFFNPGTFAIDKELRDAINEHLTEVTRKMRRAIQVLRGEMNALKTMDLDDLLKYIFRTFPMQSIAQTIMETVSANGMTRKEFINAMTKLFFQRGAEGEEKSELAKLRERVMELEDEMNSTRRGLESRLQEMEIDRNAIDSERVELERKLIDIEDLFCDAEEKNVKLEADLANAEQSLLSLKSELDRTNIGFAGVEDLSEQHRNAMDELSKKDAEITRLLAKMSFQEGEIVSANARASASERELADAVSANATADASVSPIQLSPRIDEREELEKSLAEEKEARDKQIEEDRAAADKLRTLSENRSASEALEGLRKAQEEIALLKAKQANSRAKAQKFSIQLEQYKNEIMDTFTQKPEGSTYDASTALPTPRDEDDEEDDDVYDEDAQAEKEGGNREKPLTVIHGLYKFIRETQIMQNEKLLTQTKLFEEMKRAGESGLVQGGGGLDAEERERMERSLDSYKAHVEEMERYAAELEAKLASMGVKPPAKRTRWLTGEILDFLVPYRLRYTGTMHKKRHFALHHDAACQMKKRHYVVEECRKKNADKTMEAFNFLRRTSPERKRVLNAVYGSLSRSIDDPLSPSRSVVCSPHSSRPVSPTGTRPVSPSSGVPVPPPPRMMNGDLPPDANLAPYTRHSMMHEVVKGQAGFIPTSVCPSARDLEWDSHDLQSPFPRSPIRPSNFCHLSQHLLDDYIYITNEDENNNNNNNNRCLLEEEHGAKSGEEKERQKLRTEMKKAKQQEQMFGDFFGAVRKHHPSRQSSPGGSGKKSPHLNQMNIERPAPHQRPAPPHIDTTTPRANVFGSKTPLRMYRSPAAPCPSPTASNLNSHSMMASNLNSPSMMARVTPTERGHYDNSPLQGDLLSGLTLPPVHGGQAGNIGMDKVHGGSTEMSNNSPPSSWRKDKKSTKCRGIVAVPGVKSISPTLCTLLQRKGETENVVFTDDTFLCKSVGGIHQEASGKRMRDSPGAACKTTSVYSGDKNVTDMRECMGNETTSWVDKGDIFRNRENKNAAGEERSWSPSNRTLGRTTKGLPRENEEKEEKEEKPREEGTGTFEIPNPQESGIDSMCLPLTYNPPKGSKAQQESARQKQKQNTSTMNSIRDNNTTTAQGGKDGHRRMSKSRPYLFEDNEKENPMHMPVSVFSRRGREKKCTKREKKTIEEHNNNNNTRISATGQAGGEGKGEKVEFNIDARLLCEGKAKTHEGDEDEEEDMDRGDQYDITHYHVRSLSKSGGGKWSRMTDPQVFLSQPIMTSAIPDTLRYVVDQSTRPGSGMSTRVLSSSGQSTNPNSRPRTNPNSRPGTRPNSRQSTKLMSTRPTSTSGRQRGSPRMNTTLAGTAIIPESDGGTVGRSTVNNNESMGLVSDFASNAKSAGWSLNTVIYSSSDSPIQQLRKLSNDLAVGPECSKDLPPSTTPDFVPSTHPWLPLRKDRNRNIITNPGLHYDTRRSNPARPNDEAVDPRSRLYATSKTQGPFRPLPKSRVLRTPEDIQWDFSKEK